MLQTPPSPQSALKLQGAQPPSGSAPSPHIGSHAVMKQPSAGRQSELNVQLPQVLVVKSQPGAFAGHCEATWHCTQVPPAQ